jgi:hypothetical protein
MRQVVPLGEGKTYFLTTPQSENTHFYACTGAFWPHYLLMRRLASEPWRGFAY